jgi:hypothetical protein
LTTAGRRSFLTSASSRRGSSKGDNPPATRHPTLLTVDFRALGPRETEVTLRQDQLLTLIDREGNREGWRQCFLKLDAVLMECASDAHG